MELTHSEDFQQCHTLADFQKYKQDLVEIIRTNRTLNLPTSAWEKELVDVEAEIKRLEDEPRRTWY